MAFTILLALLAGCAPAADPAGIWAVYSSPEYGFSISYPAALELSPAEDGASVWIGRQIRIWVSDVDPLECRGDCALVERTEPATVAGLAAKRVTGYIGSIGGNVPQRYLTYILQANGRYYSFTLYALGFEASGGDPTTIRPLEEADVLLFEQILETFRFTD